MYKALYNMYTILYIIIIQSHYIYTNYINYNYEKPHDMKPHKTV